MGDAFDSRAVEFDRSKLAAVERRRTAIGVEETLASRLQEA